MHVTHQDPCHRCVFKKAESIQPSVRKGAAEHTQWLAVFCARTGRFLPACQGALAVVRCGVAPETSLNSGGGGCFGGAAQRLQHPCPAATVLTFCQHSGQNPQQPLAAHRGAWHAQTQTNQPLARTAAAARRPGTSIAIKRAGARTRPCQPACWPPETGSFSLCFSLPHQPCPLWKPLCLQPTCSNPPPL